MEKEIVLKWLNGLNLPQTSDNDKQVIDYLKVLVMGEKEPKKAIDNGWEKMFEKLWLLYPRKVDKILAKKTFEHKVRGLSIDDCKDKCILIYKAQMSYQDEIDRDGTEMKFVKHYSSWLNSTIPDSKYYKGR